MIKYGTVEYFELLNLQDKLKAWKWDKLDLLNLDKLRIEVDMKVKAINQVHNDERRISSLQN